MAEAELTGELRLAGRAASVGWDPCGRTRISTAATAATAAVVAVAVSAVTGRRASCHHGAVLAALVCGTGNPYAPNGAACATIAARWASVSGAGLTSFTRAHESR